MADASTKNMAHSGNRLIDCLSDGERPGVVDLLERVSLARGQEVYRRNANLTHVYFPVTGVCSFVVGMTSGESVEAATIGNEGMLGCHAYLDVDVVMHQTVAQVEGDVLRMEVEAFRELLKMNAALESIVRRYLAYTIHHACQTLACNTLHSVEERTCRWLLTTHDRVRKDLFPITHEVLAEMLGTHRQTVTGIAGTLQREGLITYRRGVVRIMNRHALERATCECYAVGKDLFEALVGCP